MKSFFDTSFAQVKLNQCVAAVISKRHCQMLAALRRSYCISDIFQKPLNSHSEAEKGNFYMVTSYFR